MTAISTSSSCIPDPVIIVAFRSRGQGQKTVHGEKDHRLWPTSPKAPTLVSMMRGDGKTPRGHAVLPHTADVQIEAWAATPAECYEEAVAAFLELFTDGRGASTVIRLPFEVGPGDPRELLVQLLEETVVLVETDGVAPVEAHVDVLGDRLRGSFAVAPVDDVELTGSIPKGVSYEELSFEPEDGRWHCLATVDV